MSRHIIQRFSGLGEAVRSLNSFCSPTSPLRRPQHASVLCLSHQITSNPRARACFHSQPAYKASNQGERPRAGFGEFDVLGDAPIPPTSVDLCTPKGFHLASGTKITNGDGVLLVAGEAFRWRPWVAKGSRNLFNKKGQWEVPKEAFGLFSLLWPRPDFLIIGAGPEIRPLSPETRQYLNSLGMRVDILDTRNAAAQYNILATERGVEDVAAALIPMGWKDDE